MAATAIAGVMHYIGTAAERAALSTTGITAGSTFYETDTPALYIFDGSSWSQHIATVQTGDTINIANIEGIDAEGAALTANPLVIGTEDASGNVRPVNPTYPVPAQLTGSIGTESLLLASAERTTNTSTAVQTNTDYRGVLVFLKVTAASGTGGLKPIIIGRVEQPVTASFNLNAEPTIINSTGSYLFALYPDDALTVTTGIFTISSGITQVTKNILLPKWYIAVTHGDASAYTYSLSVIPLK